MPRACICLVTHMLVAIAVVAAAPRPRPGSSPGVWFDGWRVEETQTGCQVDRKAEKLTITVPGEDHSLRLLREVKGDFTIEVRLRGNFLPSGNIGNRSAGIVLMSGGTGVTLQRKVRFPLPGDARDEEISYSIEKPCGNLAGIDGVTPLSEFVSLRLQRRGQLLLFQYLADGSKCWRTLNKEWGGKLPETVKVGVFVESTAPGAFKAEFDRFALTPAAK